MNTQYVTLNMISKIQKVDLHVKQLFSAMNISLLCISLHWQHSLLRDGCGQVLNNSNCPDYFREWRFIGT